MKTYDLQRIKRLVETYNELVNKHDIPSGEFCCMVDDGYTGECYSIDFCYNNGTAALSIEEDTSIFFACSLKTGESFHCTLCDTEDEEVAKWIKRCIK